MLKIDNLAEFRARIAGKEEIREIDLGEGLTSFCYMVAMDDTFNDEWSRECRGIVFNGDTVVCRPLQKFFNVNEREDTRVENIDWAKVIRVMSKVDGSLISTVKVEDGIKLKSKKSFESDVAKEAAKFLEEQPELKRFIADIANLDATAIFEWTSPDARIVIAYPQPELTLLHIRDNTSGRYWHSNEIRLHLLDYDHTIKLVDEPVFGVPNEELGYHLLELAKTVEGIEGWVIQFEDGNMVKLKTEWYLLRHKTFTELRERDVAEMVLKGAGLDDLKSMLVGDNIDIREINEVEARVVEDIRQIERTLLSFASKKDFELPRKEFAIKFQPIAGQYFGMLMSMYLGKQPDYNMYFEKNFLKQTYSLRQLAMIPSKAELE